MMLNYRVDGQEGPALLLIHGFGITFAIWSALRPLLANRYRLVLIELPGIGLSPPPPPNVAYYRACADAIEELRMQLGIAEWGVVSYSSGARAAEAYITTYPQHVSRAAFVCAIYVPRLRWRSLRAITWLDRRAPAFGNWALSGKRLHALVRALGFSGRHHPLIENWSAEISAQSLDSLKRSIRELPDPGRGLFDLPVPSLFVWGRYDVVPVRPLQLRRRRNGQLHYAVSADHSAPQTAAAELAPVLDRFFMGGESTRVPIYRRLRAHLSQVLALDP
jgi:pimeloyl-ACP methyl ester carboxylesterase